MQNVDISSCCNQKSMYHANYKKAYLSIFFVKLFGQCKDTKSIMAFK